MSDKFNHLHLLIPLNPQRIDFQKLNNDLY
ncbi:MAG: hypothetical protein RL705_1428 [Bacteroidota bacterium]|jgi:hypothetical protein